ncbi:methyltransferase-like protein 25B [Helicoverpa zea]|uniref:methyltransferase-like protein 25B n=1 Tax=Helicoverpa zea TaxID=7113 RepID=UPI001F59EBC9|nr:methyltransferase-like protein 25B [Helicoverpa zea]
MTSKIENVKSNLEMSLKVIRMYDWLLDLYVLDFFVDDHWNKLPSTWRKTFEHMDPQELGHILSNRPTNQLLPLSFLALIKTIEALTILRGRQNQNINKKVTTTNLDSCKNHPKLKNLFLKHVKLKKRHEISLMADVVVGTALQSNCNSVIDFGSGLGHLVRVLAYRDDLYAAGIECQGQLTEEARKLDLQLEYTVKKHLSAEAVSKLRRPLHLNMTLSNHDQLRNLPLPDCMHNYGLIGLHPCGDLGPLLLKHFINSENIKFICVVGCCFMKLSCDGENQGYPMSRYVKSLDSKLSYPSREIACHAIEVYCERLCKGNYEDLKIHAYRAALERILVDHDPKLKHAPVRSIKHSDTMTFEKYCLQALERINVPLPTSPAVLRRGYEDLAQWRRVVVVYTLRLALAPLVETVVLLDRVLYVLEHGISCEIRPVFDPKLSPRNHIIIAKRL